MAMTDKAMLELCEAMRQTYGAGVEFELQLGDLVGRYRLAHEARMRDAQAAELLPLGRVIAAERLRVAPSTVYKMAHRHRRAIVLHLSEQRRRNAEILEPSDNR